MLVAAAVLPQERTQRPGKPTLKFDVGKPTPNYEPGKPNMNFNVRIKFSCKQHGLGMFEWNVIGVKATPNSWLRNSKRNSSVERQLPIRKLQVDTSLWPEPSSTTKSPPCFHILVCLP
ncbi:hypothetical protein MRX96_048884 [Rhipicephalus microplus]